MKFLFLSLLFLLISSCSFVKFNIHGIPDKEGVAKIQYPNKFFWIGRSSDEVLTHREFAILPLDRREGENGDKVFVFKNTGGFYSSNSCLVGQFGGSCSGSSGEITCNHVFFIRGKKVTNYERMGSCSEEQLRFRPVDKEDKPLLHPEEIAQIQREIASEARLVCSVTADCKDGKTCSEGKCRSLGISGRLFSK
jgi:hypothetical protein